MAKDGKETLSREERLAAKLRENLRRRKAQGREHSGTSDEGAQTQGTKTLPKSDPKG